MIRQRRAARLYSFANSNASAALRRSWLGGSVISIVADQLAIVPL
jgi:hypothetical protein